MLPQAARGTFFLKGSGTYDVRKSRTDPQDAQSKKAESIVVLGLKGVKIEGQAPDAAPFVLRSAKVNQVHSS